MASWGLITTKSLSFCKFAVVIVFRNLVAAHINSIRFTRWEYISQVLLYLSSAGVCTILWCIENGSNWHQYIRNLHGVSAVNSQKRFVSILFFYRGTILDASRRGTLRIRSVAKGGILDGANFSKMDENIFWGAKNYSMSLNPTVSFRSLKITTNGLLNLVTWCLVTWYDAPIKVTSIKLVEKCNMIQTTRHAKIGSRYIQWPHPTFLSHFTKFLTPTTHSIFQIRFPHQLQ